MLIQLSDKKMKLVCTCGFKRLCWIKIVVALKTAILKKLHFFLDKSDLSNIIDV